VERTQCVTSKDSSEAAAGDELAAARSARFAEHARRYTGLGWALIRLDGKRPKGAHWETTQPEASPEHAAGLWSEWGKRWNVGVVLGTSGLCVVEYDTEEAGETLIELLGGELPLTPIAETGRKRLHLYFRDPGADKGARDGLELRAGARQCVLPPSEHPETGQPYKWLRKLEPWAVPLAEVPASVLAYFAETRRNGAPEPLPERIAAGEGRNRMLASLAGTLRRRVQDENELVAMLEVANKTRCDPPLDKQEVAAIAKSILAYNSKQQSAQISVPPPIALEAGGNKTDGARWKRSTTRLRSSSGSWARRAGLTSSTSSGQCNTASSD
jgi:hypothetical protein